MVCQELWHRSCSVLWNKLSSAEHQLLCGTAASRQECLEEVTAAILCHLGVSRGVPALGMCREQQAVSLPSSCRSALSNAGAVNCSCGRRCSGCCGSADFNASSKVTATSYSSLGPSSLTLPTLCCSVCPPSGCRTECCAAQPWG